MTAQRYLLNRENIEVVSKIKENKEHYDEVLAQNIIEVDSQSMESVWEESILYQWYVLVVGKYCFWINHHAPPHNILRGRCEGGGGDL